MDDLLHYFDEFFGDLIYYDILPKYGFPLLARASFWRQALTLITLTSLVDMFIYLLSSSVNFFFFYDKEVMKHPKFLSNQIQMEITTSLKSFVPMAILNMPFFYLEINGYSQLYDNFNDYNASYTVLSIVLFMIFCDFGIYWVHRLLHTKWFYAKIHKIHHRWVISTPFAGHSFHWLDGFMMALPYHYCPFIFPIQKHLYLGMLSFGVFWGVILHDTEYFKDEAVSSSAINHTIHHLTFNYNFGQFFMICDHVFGTYKAPSEEILNLEKHHLPKDIKQANSEFDQVVEVL